MSPSITPFHHPALGSLILLSGLSPTPLRLTPQEARTLALALAAVSNGQSESADIYLSPISSDDEFHALRQPDGMICNGIFLSWAELDQMCLHLQNLLTHGGSHQ